MSQTKRDVIVASPASNQSKKYSTNATTWGELKSEISDLYQDGLEAIVNPGRTSLTRDEATLPTGAFNLFLIPTKNKAGGVSPSSAQSLGKEIGDAIVKAASMVEEQELSDLRDNLIETVEDFFGVTIDDCPECQDVLEEARQLMP